MNAGKVGREPRKLKSEKIEQEMLQGDAIYGYCCNVIMRHNRVERAKSARELLAV